MAEGVCVRWKVKPGSIASPLVPCFNSVSSHDPVVSLHVGRSAL